MIQLIKTVLSLSFVTCCPLFAQEFISLQQCRQMALSYNQDLKAATYDVSARESLHQMARADFYPKISASGQASYTGNPREYTWTQAEQSRTLRGSEEQYDLSVYLEQPLYQGGKLQATRRKAAGEQILAQLNVEHTVSEVLLETDRRYWNYVACQELLQVSRQYFYTSDSLVQVIRKRVEEQLTDRSDLLMAEVKRNDAAFRLREAERNWEVARLTLSSFIGRGDSMTCTADTIVAPLYLAGEPVASADSVLQCRPEYAMANRQVTIQEEQTKINQAQYLPHFSIGVSGQLNSPGYNFRPDMSPNYQLYAKLSVPVFEWGKRKSQKTADRYRTDMARETADKMRDQILLELQVADHNRKETARQVMLTESSRHKACENSLLSMDQYQEGMISITEVLDAQMYYLEACRNFIVSKYNAQIARSEYLRACGHYNQ